jgi:8-amino-7-oxononanoate synthase
MTEREAHKLECEPSPADAVLAAASKSFAGLFADNTPRNCQPTCLDTSRTRRWFDVIEWGVKTGHYSYQQPLEGRSGPRVRVGGHELLLVSAYDYLGLIGHPVIENAAATAIGKYGTGPGGVRLLTGTSELHCQLERRLATFKETEAALTVSSGYLANIGVIPALVGAGDRVLLDARVHRSSVDGCKLAGVSCQSFAHNDVAALERKLAKASDNVTTLIVVEGVYSMDGDICPLPEIVRLKERYGAILLVDEAHSLGVLGASGRGVHEHFGLPAESVDFWTGSLSKAIPANGGYVASSAKNILYLQHEISPFFFSSALCPSMTAAALAALNVIEAEPERIQAVAHIAERLRTGLAKLGFDTGTSASPIIPVILGDHYATWKVARKLLDEGIWATAIVPPAVPWGSSRLRLCATASHSDSDIDAVLRAFAACGTTSPMDEG